MNKVFAGASGRYYTLREFIEYPFTTEQVLKLHEIANEPDIRVLADESTLHIPVQEIRRLISDAIEGCAEEEAFYYILENQADKMPAGVFGLTRTDTNTFEVGFWISKNDRGTGKRALKMLMNDWADKEFLIVSETTRRNLPAIKILESAGFVLTEENSGVLHFLKDFRNAPA